MSAMSSGYYHIYCGPTPPKPEVREKSLTFNAALKNCRSWSSSSKPPAVSS